MHISIGLLLLYCLVVAYVPYGRADVRLPPSIIRQNEDLHIYLGIDAKLQLVCDADGHPEPEYEWYKDGSPWNPKPGEVTPTPGSGNRTVPSFSHTHAGTFQCFAFNKYGKTMTRKMEVGVAIIAKFQSKEPKQITVIEGDKLMLQCSSPKSEPAPTISWKPVESLQQNAQSINIQLTRRVQIDDKGNLVFAHVMRDDNINAWYYRCFAENAIAGLSAFGSYAQISVTQNPGRTIKPAIQAYTGQGTQNGIVTALKRQSISMRCLFSGKPEPSVMWARVDNKPLPQDRITYEQFGTVLIIDKIEDYDEAVYKCTGGNSVGQSSHDISLQVEAIPEFVDDIKPKNINSTDGDDVAFNCDTESEPTADIIWYMNSEELTDANRPPRVSIDADRKTLRVADVCKDCKSGSTDLKVYGCEAENKHGSTFSSGYLNVLLPTVMTEAPVNYDLDFKEKEVTFICKGETDDSTPLKSQWLRDGQRFDYVPEEIYSVDTDEGSTLFIITTDLEQGKEYLGNYTCILSNGYSSVNASAALLEVAGALPVTTSGVGDWWWVFLIIGILLLLLLLLLCCCICLQRNKGDTYPVDEKERANGNDPEKELADSGYHDYQRPEEEPVKGSRASLNSAMKLDDSDDDASLAEYGDIDTGKFNEDGSFIGQYNTAERRRGDTNV